MSKEKIIADLQYLVTNLAQQADGHLIQSRIFAAKGFSKLADMYWGEQQLELIECIGVQNWILQQI